MVILNDYILTRRDLGSFEFIHRDSFTTIDSKDDTKTLSQIVESVYNQISVNFSSPYDLGDLITLTSEIMNDSKKVIDLDISGGEFMNDMNSIRAYSNALSKFDFKTITFFIDELNKNDFLNGFIAGCFGATITEYNLIKSLNAQNLEFKKDSQTGYELAYGENNNVFIKCDRLYADDFTNVDKFIKDAKLQNMNVCVISNDVMFEELDGDINYRIATTNSKFSLTDVSILNENIELKKKVLINNLL